MMALGSEAKQSSRSPWTDPRSLGASVVFHLIFLTLISLFAFGVSMPKAPPPPTALNAEIGPVDNRANSEAAGGAPGAIGGMSETMKLSAESVSDRAKKSTDAGERLLSDILTPSLSTPTTEKAPIGPATTGIGLLEGEGVGGGGGSGGGTGGGIGKGIGPGTEFFGAQDRASSFTYVIDCSGSMSNRNALRIAKKELMSSLDRLPPDARFSVVFYNIRAGVFPDAQGHSALMPATIENKERLRTRLATVHPDGGTDHVVALKAAIALKPEVIFFLTDAERMEASDAERVRKELGTIRIQAIEFSDGSVVDTVSPLRDLATSSGGSFRHIDLSIRKEEANPAPSPSRP
jgi:hypothetical protein